MTYGLYSEQNAVLKAAAKQGPAASATRNYVAPAVQSVARPAPSAPSAPVRTSSPSAPSSSAYAPSRNVITQARPQVAPSRSPLQLPPMMSLPGTNNLTKDLTRNDYDFGTYKGVGDTSLSDILGDNFVSKALGFAGGKIAGPIGSAIGVGVGASTRPGATWEGSITEGVKSGLSSAAQTALFTANPVLGGIAILTGAVPKFLDWVSGTQSPATVADAVIRPVESGIPYQAPSYEAPTFGGLGYVAGPAVDTSQFMTPDPVPLDPISSLPTLDQLLGIGASNPVYTPEIPQFTVPDPIPTYTPPVDYTQSNPNTLGMGTYNPADAAFNAAGGFNMYNLGSFGV